MSSHVAVANDHLSIITFHKNKKKNKNSSIFPEYFDFLCIIKMRKNESELIFCLPVKTSSYFKLKDDTDKENQKKNKLFSGFDSNVHSNQHLGSDVEIRLQVNDHIWILNKDLVYFGSIFTHLPYLKIQSAVFKPRYSEFVLGFYNHGEPPYTVLLWRRHIGACVWRNDFKCKGVVAWPHRKIQTNQVRDQ